MVIFSSRKSSRKFVKPLREALPYLETHLIGFFCKINLCEKHLRVICKDFSNITHCSLLSEYFPSVFFPFLFIESVAKAFEMLKKNYCRKCISFRKSSRSGAGTRDIETAKKELEECRG